MYSRPLHDVEWAPRLLGLLDRRRAVLDVDHVDGSSMSRGIGLLDLGRLDGRRTVWIVGRLDGRRVIRDVRRLDIWRLDVRWVVLNISRAFHNFPF